MAGTDHRIETASDYRPETTDYAQEIRAAYSGQRANGHAWDVPPHVARRRMAAQQR